jgi:hypothetical protein
MILTGVFAYGVEFAEMLALLLKRHGYLEAEPKNLDELVTACRAATLEEPKPAFVLIQEGGSSAELYVHAWDTRCEAEHDRIDCTRNGAYRTSEIIEVPGALANHPGFYDTVAEFVKAANQTLDYVGTGAEDAACEQTLACAEELKAEYLASACTAGDVDVAVEKLMDYCSGLFKDDRAAWEFLMDEQHEDNEQED